MAIIRNTLAAVALSASILPVTHAAGKAPPVIEGTRSDAKEIAAILASIATTVPQDKTLADRLLRLNIDVRTVTVSPFTAEDVKQRGGDLRRGDVNYQFSTSEPTPAALKECAIWSTFTFVRRQHLWLPTSKTANYLANGPQHCKAP